jgi:hypothetical protein
MLRLDLPLEKLSFLLKKHLDRTPSVCPSLSTLIPEIPEIPAWNSKHHKSLVVPYSLALIAVKSLLNIGITQYEILEQNFRIPARLRNSPFDTSQAQLLNQKPSPEKSLPYRNGLNLPNFGALEFSSRCHLTFLHPSFP